MITQGPYDLTLKTTLPLNDPGANSNNPATAVQIQNASPFIVEVNAGGILLTIQSFTAQTVPTSGGGQQMSVTPIQSGPSAQQTAAKSLTVAWLLAGESAPMLDGPLTAAAIANTLGQSGLSGASVITAFLVVSGGANRNFATIPDGTYRLWNWGQEGDLLPAAQPSKGGVFIQFTSTSSLAQDNIGFVCSASSRLAGMVFAVGGSSSGVVTVFNNTDEEITAFLVYSAA